jgi:steroid 5-alpha reductase family enzyme
MRTKMQRRAFALISLLSIFTCSQAFRSVQKTNSLKDTGPRSKYHQHLKQIMTDIRGGSQLDAAPIGLVSAASAVGSVITQHIKSGPFGVFALAAVASAVLLPITQYRNSYGFSVGYGLTVAAIGLAVRSTLGVAPTGLEDVLTAAVVFYGLRLASFLLARHLLGMRPPATRADPARIKRIPFALSLALFYGFMTTPVLYALRAPAVPGSVAGKIAVAGTALAWFGAILEAVADTHKFISKSSSRGSKDFKGPSTGVYRLTRHPNYTGEVLFWLGTYVAGAPSFGGSVVAWLASSVGLYGIVTIMVGATRRLETNHAEKYGGQKAYESWKKEVPVAFIPFFK